MNLLELLRRREGKTLEFKRDLTSPAGMLRTVVATTGWRWKALACCRSG